jgi:DNA-binding NarL/FixJ family response regulator
VEALSERERQIAELVAAGHTNRQIADRLFLSTRTVERHLSHVFHKLDVSSRAQVGARLTRG